MATVTSDTKNAHFLYKKIMRDCSTAGPYINSPSIHNPSFNFVIKLKRSVNSLTESVMEVSRSVPISIEGNTGERRSLMERCAEGAWENLERFWDNEKQRLQDFEGQTEPLSSSLEKQLLHEDFIKEPSFKKEHTGDTENLRTVDGSAIKDIPTSYVVGGFEPHELTVIGTCVDKRILQGFNYKVRKNLTQEYLFNGNALHLENIGLGYGKRLTFQSNNLNENANYFWSDSRPEGYGFTFQAISPGSAFTILCATTGQNMGRVTVKNPALSPDTELSTVVKETGLVEKIATVHFTCDVILSDSCNEQKAFAIDMPVHGIAKVIRHGLTARAKVGQITLQNFVIPGCKLSFEERLSE